MSNYHEKPPRRVALAGLGLAVATALTACGSAPTPETDEDFYVLAGEYLTAWSYGDEDVILDLTCEDSENHFAVKQDGKDPADNPTTVDLNAPGAEKGGVERRTIDADEGAQVRVYGRARTAGDQFRVTFKRVEPGSDEYCVADHGYDFTDSLYDRPVSTS